MTEASTEWTSSTGKRRRAESIVADCLVWDNHSCMPLRSDDDRFLPELERFISAGVDVVSLNAGFDAMPWENTVLVLAHFRNWLLRHRDRYALVDQVEDIEVARRGGKLSVVFDIEGGCALNDNIDMVQLYYDLGVRWMLIAYNKNNSLGGGCQDEDTGLTEFGHRVVDEMARVGMVACCSHTGFRTCMQVMERSGRPVIFSHSNPLGLWHHKRNIDDELIKACAATGGVICLNGIGMFLGHNVSNPGRVAQHIDYVVQKVGPEHAGIGLDYVFDQQELKDYVAANPAIFPPQEGYDGGVNMLPPEGTVGIVEALLDRGYEDEQIRMILGENLLRVANAVWR